MTGEPLRPRGHYVQTLASIHEHMRPRTYLEIGMYTGKSLALASAETLVIGVDPEPRVWAPINSNAQLFFEPSDDFFSGHDVRSLLAGRALDLAFIDGMHLFEYALRDFRNIERLCGPESVVLVHDCLPPDAESTSRERTTQRLWTGDTWKLVPCLKALRPDLDISTVAVGPSGLTIIRNLDPDSTVLWDRYDEAEREFGALEFTTVEPTRNDVLNVVPNDWDTIAARLPRGLAPSATRQTKKRYPRHPAVLRHQAVRHAKLAARRVLRVRPG
jgi:hypothetical protein